MCCIHYQITVFDRYSFLWPETTTFERSQRGYCSCWPTSFIVAKDQNIWEVTEGYFPCEDTYSSLWPETTSFTKTELELQFGILTLVTFASLDSPAAQLTWTAWIGTLLRPRICGSDCPRIDTHNLGTQASKRKNYLYWSYDPSTM